MIHKNWQELIRPSQLDIKPGADPMRQATMTAEPLVYYHEPHMMQVQMSAASVLNVPAPHASTYVEYYLLMLILNVHEWPAE